MLLPSLIAGCALLGLVFLVLAIRALKRARILASSFHTLLAACFLISAIAVMMLGGTLLTYDRLTHEQQALELQFVRLGDRHYRAALTYPDNRRQHFELRGDEWQVDARVLKWEGLANVMGFDTIYRLERIGGRYRDINDERTAVRTVHSLHEPDRVDVWELARKARDWIGFVDARYGSATFLPMEDGALYQVTVSQTGLLARPLNQAAKQAVGGWR